MSTRLVDQSFLRGALRRVRKAQLGAQRLLQWISEPEFAPRYASTTPSIQLGSVRVPIARTGANPTLEQGKRTNVMLAARALHGIKVAPDRPFSFWRVVGPLTAARGFAAGMEIQAGCSVPTIGGGVCLVTNALYQLAIESGWQVLERHAHTAALGAIDAFDATVAFPHVDLRFVPSSEAVIVAEVRGDVLVVQAFASAPGPQVKVGKRVTDLGKDRFRVVTTRTIAAANYSRSEIVSAEVKTLREVTHQTCLTCNELTCSDGNRLLAAAGLQREPAR